MRSSDRSFFSSAKESRESESSTSKSSSRRTPARSRPTSAGWCPSHPPYTTSALRDTGLLQFGAGEKLRLTVLVGTDDFRGDSPDDDAVGRVLHDARVGGDEVAFADAHPALDRHVRRDPRPAADADRARDAAPPVDRAVLEDVLERADDHVGREGDLVFDPQAAHAVEPRAAGQVDVVADFQAV